MGKKKKGYDKLPTYDSDNFSSNDGMDDDDFVNQHSRSQQMMRKQDESLDVLSEGVLRLGEMSIGIHEELSQQNKMLDGLDEDLDKAAFSLDVVTKKTQELIKKSGGCKYFAVIVVLVFVVLLLFLLIIYT